MSGKHDPQNSNNVKGGEEKTANEMTSWPSWNRWPCLTTAGNLSPQTRQFEAIEARFVEIEAKVEALAFFFCRYYRNQRIQIVAAEYRLSPQLSILLNWLENVLIELSPFSCIIVAFVLSHSSLQWLQFISFSNELGPEWKKVVFLSISSSSAAKQKQGWVIATRLCARAFEGIVHMYAVACRLC